MNALKQLILSITVVALAATATNTSGSTLTLIPIPPWLSGEVVNQARAISPDGKYVVGFSGTGSQGGYLYNVANNLVIQPNAGGAVPSRVSGIAYRTDPVSGQTQLILDGLSAGYQANWMTTDGGSTWGAQRRDTGFSPATGLEYNTLGAAAGTDKFYQIVRSSDNKQHYINQGSNAWDNVTAPWFTNNIYLDSSPDIGNMNGVSATGRAIGRRRPGGISSNYVIDYPPDSATAFYFNGLAGTDEGEAFSVSADGNAIFGRSPIAPAGVDLYGYKVINPGPSQTIAPLPEFGDTGGSTSRCVPYGCTTDGNFAVGMNFRGALDERAVLWDTSDANPTNWTVVDLTDMATSEGILGSFTRLARGYSVGKNAAGNLVVAGFGLDSSANVRAFVMVVGATPAPQPCITSITGAGTGSVTVNYTNTLAGTNYTLQYSTNFNTTNWTTVGSQTAAGTSDSQTDASATSHQRYYRVYYVTP